MVTRTVVRVSDGAIVSAVAVTASNDENRNNHQPPKKKDDGSEDSDGKKNAAKETAEKHHQLDSIANNEGEGDVDNLITTHVTVTKTKDENKSSGKRRSSRQKRPVVLEDDADEDVDSDKKKRRRKQGKKFIDLTDVPNQQLILKHDGKTDDFSSKYAEEHQIKIESDHVFNSSTNECDVLYITAPRTDEKTEGAFRINSKQLADLKIGLSSDVVENLQCCLSRNKIAKTETGIEGEKTFFFQRSTIIALSIAFHTLGIDFQKNCVIISHEALVKDQENIFKTVKQLDPRLIIPASWETAKICYGAVDQFEQAGLRCVIYPGKKFSNVLENQERIVSHIFENAKHDDAVRACKVGEKCLVCDACRSKENNVDLVNSHFRYRTVTQSLKAGFAERERKRSGLGCIEVAHAISNQEQGGKENDVTTFVRGPTFHYSSGKPLKGTIHCQSKLFDNATYVLKILGGIPNKFGIPGITNGGGNYLHTIDWKLRYPTGTSAMSEHQQKQRGGYFEFQSVGIWPITPDSINQIKTNQEREALELLGAMLVNVIQSLREKNEISPRELGKMKDDVSKRRKDLGLTDN